MAKRGGGGGRDTGRKRTGRGRRARIETSAGGVVYRRRPGGIHFLLIRDPYENWGLPKGHVEGGETPKETALREISEETGLTGLHAAAELPTIDWYFRDRGRLIHKFCHFYLVEAPRGEPRPQVEEGITACVWLSPEEAVRTITYENAREVLRAAARTLAPAAAGREGD
ncbi:MAG TPA: NUDIX hydrolase [Longimicrobiales bacterium]